MIFLVNETVISAKITLGIRKQSFSLFWLNCHLIPNMQYVLAFNSINKIVIYGLGYYVIVC